MRTKPHQQTEQEVATRKRLRLICEWFQALNGEIAKSQLPEQGLPLEMVAKITAQNFDRADLMAIRGRPHYWTKSNPYEWLWILHRYQNKQVAGGVQ